jgi:hypothetical protein
MTTHLSISNFLGISSAEIDVAPITLIAGANAAGKSSVLMAAGVALTGQVIPVDGLPKSSAGRLVHSGGAAGEIQLTTDAGTSTTTYPEAKRETTGAPLEISRTAAGLESLVEIPVKERAVAVSKMLCAEPTVDALKTELAKANVPAGEIEAVSKTVRVSGWDAAHEIAKQSGARLKGAWEQITGDRYGSAKAPTWVPSTWSTDLQVKTEADLISELKQETEWLEAAIAENAVQSSEIAALTESAAGLAAAKSTVDFLNTEIDGLKKTGKLMQEGLAKLPSAEQPVSQPCPHCGGSVTISGVKVVKVEPVDEATIKERAAAIEETRKSISAVAGQIKTKQDAVSVAWGNVQAAQTAEAKLKKISAQKPATGEHKSADDCRLRVTVAETRLAAWRSKTTADAKSAEIVNNQIVVDILAPNGMRLVALTEKLAAFNDSLIRICECAGWRHVALRADMGVSFGGTPYMLASKSEQWRVRVALQIATAKIDGSDIVLLDGADILDSAGRNGLVKMLINGATDGEGPCMAIIGMTINRLDMVPDVSKLSGAAYWIEAGVAKKI